MNGGLAQLARALALQARGHRFDSDILHKKTVLSNLDDDDTTRCWSTGSQPEHLQQLKAHSSQLAAKSGKLQCFKVL
jgi:hypothetical protein